MNTDFAEYADGYLSRLGEVLGGISAGEVEALVKVLLDTRECGRSIFFAGNGGSAATSSHFANDLSIGTRQSSKPFRVISLCDNLATLTALGNDYGYEQIFSKQISVYGNEGDALVTVSASGNSPNLVRAVEVAKAKGIVTVAITAFDGGILKQIADLSVHVPTKQGEYGPAEDAHLVLDHLITNFLCSANLE